MRRLSLFLVLFSQLSLGSAAEIKSIDAAWAYLARPGKIDRWVVIGSKKNKGYVQCERMPDFVLCPFPVWAKLGPGPKRVAPRKPRPTPHPEVPGTTIKEYLAATKVASLKETLKRHRIAANDVYSQMVDESGRIVGTAYDVKIALDLNFSRFVPLVEDLLNRVWDTNKQDGYLFDSDS